METPEFRECDLIDRDNVFQEKSVDLTAFLPKCNQHSKYQSTLCTPKIEVSIKAISRNCIF